MKHKFTNQQKEEKILNSALSGKSAPNVIPKEAFDKLTSLEERIQNLFHLINRLKRSPSCMLFFVMYDITSDKVRNLVAKYLIKKGCFRLQHSIFLGDLEKEVYEKMKVELAEVQSSYDNDDSILFVPVSASDLTAMKIIGRKINLDFIMDQKNTLFF